jgi:hypothetical protein
MLMNRQQAEALCERLAREHPYSDSYKWLARQGGEGEWSVVKVRLPESLRRDPTKATVEAKPKPPEADDPRPAMWRDVGSPWAAGGG